MRVNTSRGLVAEARYEALKQGSVVLDYSGTCSTPVEMHMFGYPDELAVKVLGTEPDRAIAQQMAVRCRKCRECLRHRARLWTARAIDETRASRRTWFGTLTLDPSHQTWARYSALQRMQRRQSDMSADNVFKESVAFIGKEITLFLKRLRKRTPFRYLLVTEAHKSGLPHFHVLIHEYQGQLSKRALESSWRFGFSHWRLVDTDSPQQCGYACKYLAKSALTRVRASQDYGRPPVGRITEQMEKATRLLAETTGITPPVKQGSPDEVPRT